MKEVVIPYRTTHTVTNGDTWVLKGSGTERECGDKPKVYIRTEEERRGAFAWAKTILTCLQIFKNTGGGGRWVRTIFKRPLLGYPLALTFSINEKTFRLNFRFKSHCLLCVRYTWRFELREARDGSERTMVQLGFEVKLIFSTRHLRCWRQFIKHKVIYIKRVESPGITCILSPPPR